MSELGGLGLRRKTRLVSGPQGPRVVLDGQPTLVLCSGNYLGLADHPRVREAAAEAAMRWGVGAGASRLTCGTMTIHRRLEECVAAFLHRQSALLFGSGYLAAVGVITALARPGDVVFSDEQNSGSLVDGCALSGAELFVYDHLDVEHLRWGIAKAEGRGALIVTESVFSIDGRLAPLEQIVELAKRRRIRLLVDESHGVGTLDAGGRGALAELGLEDQVDALLGTLGNSLASYGGFVACDRELADYLLNTARTMRFSAAPSPPDAAAALAALGLLEQRPQLVAKVRANALVLRTELERHGFGTDDGKTPVVSIPVGDSALASEISDAALQRGVLIEPIGPPVVASLDSRLRLTVMASHRREELADAAEAVAEAAASIGFTPGAATLDEEFEYVEDELEFADDELELATAPLQIFDVEAIDRLAA